MNAELLDRPPYRRIRSQQMYPPPQWDRRSLSLEPIVPTIGFKSYSKPLRGGLLTLGVLAGTFYVVEKIPKTLQGPSDHAVYQWAGYHRVSLPIDR